MRIGVGSELLLEFVCGVITLVYGFGWENGLRLGGKLDILLTKVDYNGLESSLDSDEYLYFSIVLLIFIK